MNASEKATSLSFVSKITAIINLFQSKFKDAIPDLTPWLDDPVTRSTLDPNSIDLGFHFPSNADPRHTLLLQIRLQPISSKSAALSVMWPSRVVELEISSHGHSGCLWEFSTLYDWHLAIQTKLSAEYQAQVKSFCQDVLEVFNSTEYSHHHQNN